MQIQSSSLVEKHGKQFEKGPSAMLPFVICSEGGVQKQLDFSSGDV